MEGLCGVLVTLDLTDTLNIVAVLLWRKKKMGNFAKKILHQNRSQSRPWEGRGKERKAETGIRRAEHVPAGAGRVACRRQPEGGAERERARQRAGTRRGEETADWKVAEF
jgi:hypothetical protein